MGAIGFISTLFVMWIGHDYFFFKQIDSFILIWKYEGPSAFGYGCVGIGIIFFRMYLEGVKQLGLLNKDVFDIFNSSA